MLQLTIHRPDRANALTPAMAQALCDGLASAGDDGEVAAVVLRGAGTTAFCSGFDLDRIGLGPTGLEAVMGALASCPVPVIAAVNGDAVGAGFELACRCDLRIVRRGARVGLPAVRLGVAYRADGLAAIMTTAPGARLALLTGRLVPADALAGFADAIADPEQFDSTVADVLATLAEAAPRALGYTVAALRAAGAGRLEAEAPTLASAREAIMAGDDVQEAVAARTEGRTPRFAPRPASPR